MGVGQAVWHTGPDHFLSADIDGFRLVVQGSEHPGKPAHFQVMRRDAEGRRTLVGSGTEADVRAAMAAAGQMAEALARRQAEPD